MGATYHQPRCEYRLVHWHDGPRLMVRITSGVCYTVLGWRGADTLALTCRDTSNPPQNVTNPDGVLLLGCIYPNGTGGENLDVGQLSLAPLNHVFLSIYVMLVSDHPLAQGFYLSDGETYVVVPNVTPGNNYIVVRECPCSAPLHPFMMFTAFRSHGRLGEL